MKTTSSLPSALALFWYQHWSTTLLCGVQTLVLLLLSLIPRQAWYAVLLVAQIAFPWKRVVHRLGAKRKDAAAAAPATSTAPPSSAASAAAAVGMRSVVASVEAAPRRGGDDRRPNESVAHPAHSEDGGGCGVATSESRTHKLIFLQHRWLSKVLTIAPLVHLIVGALGGILVASVPFLERSYRMHSAWFRMVGIWNPSLHWATYAAQLILLILLSGVSYMLSKRTDRILKAERRDQQKLRHSLRKSSGGTVIVGPSSNQLDAPLLDLSHHHQHRQQQPQNTAKRSGSAFEPEASAVYTEPSTAGGEYGALRNAHQCSTVVASASVADYEMESSGGAGCHRMHRAEYARHEFRDLQYSRLTPGRSSLLALLSLITCLFSPSLITTIFLLIHFALLLTMLLPRSSPAKWVLLHGTSVVLMCASIVWMLVVSVLLSPQLMVGDQGNQEVLSASTWLFLIGPAGNSAFIGSSSSSSSSKVDSNSTASPAPPTTAVDAHATISLWIIGSCIAALITAHVARANVGDWTVPFRWVDAHAEVAKALAKEHTVQRAKALKFINDFASSGGAEGSEAREQLIRRICRYFPLLLIPTLWSVGCSIVNVLSFALICVVFAALMVGITRFMRLVPLLYTICAIVATVTFIPLTVQETWKLLDEHLHPSSSLSPTTELPSSFAPGSSSSGDSSGFHHGSTIGSDGHNWIDVLANALYDTDQSADFSATIIRLGVQIVAMALLVLARVVHKRTPTTTSYFHSREKRYHIRKAFSALSADIGDLKDRFLAMCIKHSHRAPSNSHSTTDMNHRGGVGLNSCSSFDDARLLGLLFSKHELKSMLADMVVQLDLHVDFTDEDVVAMWTNFTSGTNLLFRRDSSGEHTFNAIRLRRYRTYLGLHAAQTTNSTSHASASSDRFQGRSASAVQKPAAGNSRAAVTLVPTAAEVAQLSRNQFDTSFNVDHEEDLDLLLLEHQIFGDVGLQVNDDGEGVYDEQQPNNVNRSFFGDDYRNEYDVSESLFSADTLAHESTWLGDDGEEMSQPGVRASSASAGARSSRRSSSAHASARRRNVRRHQEASVASAFSFFDFVVLEHFLRQCRDQQDKAEAATAAVAAQQQAAAAIDSAGEEDEGPTKEEEVSLLTRVGQTLLQWGALASELLLRHARTFALLGMFFAAIAENDLDLEQIVYVLLFVSLLSFPTTLRPLWPATSLYAAMHISAIYLFGLAFRSKDTTTLSISRSQTLGVIGISTSNPWRTTVYLFVLICSVVDYRFMKAKVLTLDHIVLGAQWRSLLQLRPVAWFLYYLFLGLGAVTFLLVVLVQRRSLLVAGYIFVYIVSSLAGNTMHRMRWLQTFYSVFALLIASVYHIEGVFQWAQGVIASHSPSQCASLPQECMAQLGFTTVYEKPLLLTLGPWYVATVVHLATVRYARAWRSVCELDHRPITRTQFNAEFDAVSHQIIHPAVRMAMAILRAFTSGVMWTREIVARHAYKILWICLCVSGLYQRTLTHFFFIVLFIADRRGVWVVALASVAMVQLYLYPLFFIPVMPLASDVALFIGFHKSTLSPDANRDVVEFIPLVGCIIAAVADWRLRNVEQEQKDERDRQRANALSLLQLNAERLQAAAQQQPSSPRTPTTPNNGVKSQRRSKSHTVRRHIATFAAYLTSKMWRDMSFEWFTASLLLTIGVGIQRVTASIAFVLLVVALAAGRNRIALSSVWNRALLYVTGVVVLGLTLLRIGLPPSLYDASPFNEAECGPWALYLGCSAPLADLALLLIVFMALKIMYAFVPDARRAVVLVEGHETFGSLLRARSNELARLMALQDRSSSSIEQIIPPPPHTPTRNPQSIQEAIVMLCVFLPPTALLAFFDGALMPSILGVLDIVMGLLLLAFKQRVVWRFFVFWPKVMQYLMLRLLLQIVVNIPTVRQSLIESQSIAANVGVTPWSAPGQDGSIMVLGLLTVFMAVCQHRLFNEFFFAGEIIAMHSKLLMAAANHTKMVRLMKAEAIHQQLLVQEQEETIRQKLEALRRQRRLSISLTESGSFSALVPQAGGAATSASFSSSDSTRQTAPSNGEEAMNTEGNDLAGGTEASSAPSAEQSQRQDDDANQMSPVEAAVRQVEDLPPRAGGKREAERTTRTPPPPQIRARADSLDVQELATRRRQVSFLAAEDSLDVRLLTPGIPRAASAFSFLAAEGNDANDDAVGKSENDRPSTKDGPCPATTPEATTSGLSHQEDACAPSLVQDKKKAAKKKKPPLKERLQSMGSTLQALKEYINEWIEDAIQSLSAMTYSGNAPKATKSRLLRLVAVLLRVLVRHSQHVCFALFAINFVLSGTLIDLLLCLSAMCYAMTVNPWADALYWDAVLLFNCGCIVLKAVVETIVDESATPRATLRWISILVLNTGVWEPSFSEASERAAILDLAMSFVVFASVLVHRQWCIDRGVFGSSPLYVFHDTKTIATEAVGNEDEDDDDGADEDVAERQATEESPISVTTTSPINTSDISAPPSSQLLLSSANGLMGAPPSSISTVTKRISTYDGVIQLARGLWRNWTTRRGAGKDYYSLSVATQVLVIVLFVSMYYTLAGQLRGSIVEGITQDLLPGAAVMIVFALVLIMCIERVLYVTGATRCKIALHMATVLLYSIAFMVWNATITPSTRTGGTILYLAAMLSCGVSALQVREGYPLHRRHDPFTASTGVLSFVGYTVYRFIPFCFELRLLLDWSFTKTSLPLQAWTLLEDVHSEVYLRFVDLDDNEGSRTQRGMRYPKGQKVVKGFLGFAGIVTILFFPLMYYSTYNPGLSSNVVNSLTTTMSFRGVTDIYVSPQRPIPLPPSSLYAGYLESTRPSLGSYQVLDGRTMQLLHHYVCSATTWSVPPNTKKHLREAVWNSIYGPTTAASTATTGGHPEPLVLSVSLELERSGAAAGASRSQSSAFEYTLDNESSVLLLDALDASANASTPPSTASMNFSVPLRNFYSPFLINQPSRVQTLAEYIGVETNDINCNLTLSNAYDIGTASRSEFWCVECSTLFTSGNVPNFSDPGSFPEDKCLLGEASCAPYNFERRSLNTTYQPLYFVVASDSVASSNEFLANFGIIALYTTFILAIGSVLRNAVTGSSHQVVLGQMYDPSPVAELLQYIYMARSAAAREVDDASEGGGDINLALEEELYCELLDLLRSPEKVLLLTGLHAAVVNEKPLAGTIELP